MIIYKVSVIWENGDETYELYSDQMDAAIALEQVARRMNLEKKDAYFYEDKIAQVYMGSEPVMEDSSCLTSDLREAIYKHNNYEDEEA